MPEVLSGSRLFLDKLWKRLTHNPLSLLERAQRYTVSPGGLLSLVNVWRTASRVSAQYAEWLTDHMPNGDDLQKQVRSLANLRYKPTVSILVPVHNTDERWLRDALNSVFSQTYPHWELCLADDASTAGHVRPILQEYRALDSRVKVIFRRQGGHISAASNSALSLASGDFIALLDHDDELAPNALYEVVKLLNEHPDADLIYSDEDKIDVNGHHTEPYFKPGWSPSLLLNMNYITHLAVLRRQLVLEVGGFRDQFVGSQDHDLFLRVSEHTTRIFHVPQVLYHWRKIETSAASLGEVKSYAYSASLAAVEDAVARRGMTAEVEIGSYPPFIRVKHKIIEQPLVSIIIPEPSIPTSLRRKTAYEHVEYITADGCSPSEALATGAIQATGDFLLFMRSGLVPATDSWLTALLEYAQLQGVGCVGPKIVHRRNGTVHHAGLVVRQEADPGSAVFAVSDVPHILFMINGYKDAIREVSAVSVNGMMIKRARYDSVGGFNTTFKESFFDVDLCLRLQLHGFSSIYTPYSTLLTAEHSRWSYSHHQDQRLFSRYWGSQKESYYSSHLACGQDTFGIVNYRN